MLDKHKNELNELSAYLSCGDFGSRINLCFHKFSKEINNFIETGYFVGLRELAYIISESVGGKFGDIISNWIIYLIDYIDLNIDNYDNFNNILIDAFYKSTYDIGVNYKLKVNDKSFYTILLPCIKAMKASSNLKISDFLNVLETTLEKNLIQSIQIKAKVGKANYISKRAINILDPGAFVTYIAFKSFIIICRENDEKKQEEQQ